MSTYDTIIVGAGLAGLSCAVELTGQGKRVLVLEPSPTLGGRTSSWDQDRMPVESALHKFLGVYTKLPELMERCGIKVNDVISWEDEIEIVMPDGGPRAVFGASLLGRPLETLQTALGNSHFLSLADKASLIKLMALGIKDYETDAKELDNQTVAQYAARHHTTEAVIQRILRPLTEGILFYPIEEYSAFAFMAFIVAYLEHSIKFGVGAFKGGMTQVLISPIIDHIKKNGADVRSGCPVTRIIIKDGVAVGVETMGEEIRASSVVVATGLGAAQDLLSKVLPDEPWITKLPTLPGLSVQIELDKALWPVDRVVFAPGTALNVFSEQSRTTFHGSKGRLSFDLSPSTDLVKKLDKELYELVLSDAKRIGLDIEPHCLDYRIIRHERDFYRPSVGTEALRPHQQTPVRGLFLAGDYTAQPKPSTMEGAVVSGLKAAQTVLDPGY